MNSNLDMETYDSIIARKNSKVINKTTALSSRCDNCTYFIGGKKYKPAVYTKNASIYGGSGAMSSSSYTKSVLMKKYCLPTPKCKAPFPMAFGRSGCQIHYKTAEEAIEGGTLPNDWMNCLPSGC